MFLMFLTRMVLIVTSTLTIIHNNLTSTSIDSSVLYQRSQFLGLASSYRGWHRKIAAGELEALCLLFPLGFESFDLV